MHWIYLDPGAGFRDDEVEVSVKCDSGFRADLESDVLENITLHRDGRRLTGVTRVEDDADFGRGHVRVACRGGDDYVYHMPFRVLRDRDHEAYLELDPASGERGDEVDVHVGCDRGVGPLESDALDEIDLDRDGRPWRFDGTTHVLSDAEPGEHTVRVRCGDHDLVESFFVEGDDSDDSDDGSPDGGEQVKIWPKGAPETGGGLVDDTRLTSVLLGRPSVTVAELPAMGLIR